MKIKFPWFIYVFIIGMLGVVLSAHPAFSAAVADALTLKKAAEKIGVVSHKALYEIDLVSTKSGSQVINIFGRMFYEWKPVCEAWVSDHRFDLTYEYADTPPMRITSQFTTYEDFDGESMNFSSQRRRDGNVYEEIRGHANLEDKGISKAVYSLPGDLVYTLPDNTKFPMMHTIEMLQKIKEGKKFYKAVIFDGSDEKGPVEVNAFIGNPVKSLDHIEEGAKVEKALINSKARRARLAFFPLSDSSSTADYEMSIVLHENGIISDMLIEYEDFTVRQKLVALEKVEADCKASKVKE